MTAGTNCQQTLLRTVLQLCRPSVGKTQTRPEGNSTQTNPPYKQQATSNIQA